MIKLHRHIASALFLVFWITLVPGNYIHEIYAHEDTHCHPHKQLTIEEHHHHCQMLQYRFSLFVNDYSPVQVCSSTFFKEVIIPLSATPASASVVNIPPRSPPLVF